MKTKLGRARIRRTLPGFMFTYLPHHMNLKPADFHPEMMNKIQYGSQFLSIIGFRGCAKTTMSSLAYVLFEALEEEEELIVNVGDTATQAGLNLENVRYELESNELLIEDYGDMSKGISKIRSWTKSEMLLANGIRIMAKSRGQKIRGLKHREFRPKVVIVDDPEEREKVQKKEYRDKTQNWLEGDVIPAIDEFGGRLIIIGNKLHMDGLMMRIKDGKIAKGLFETLEYPLIDEAGHCTWEGKYPTKHHLREQEMKVGHIAWLREYELKVVPPEGQIIKPEWIQYYDDIIGGINKVAVGVDLAISQKETADYTAMVSGINAILEGRPKIYILPNPINAHLSSLDTQSQMKSLYSSLQIYSIPTFFIEGVAYQKAAIEFAQAQMIPVVGVNPGADKTARLQAMATFIQNGTVVFPRTGCEDLINQLLGFGIEAHDDLVDSLVYLIFGLADTGMEMDKVIRII